MAIFVFAFAFVFGSIINKAKELNKQEMQKQDYKPNNVANNTLERSSIP